MPIADILSELNSFEEKIICNICRKRCKDPVKIRVCGHYFCEGCLEKQMIQHICPMCKSCYLARDICKENLIRKTRPLLDEMRSILLKYETNEHTRCEAKLKKDKHKASSETKYKKSRRKSVDTVDEGDRYQEDQTTATENLLIGESALGDKILDFKGKKFKIDFVDNLCRKTNAKGETALHLASKRKKVEDVQNLLKKHIDINMQDFAGWTPLVRPYLFFTLTL